MTLNHQVAPKNEDVVSIPEIAESIQGNYANQRPNVDIPISKERIRVNFSGASLEGEGEVFIRTLPKPTLTIKSVFSDATSFPLANQTTIDLLDRNVTTDVINTNVHSTFPASTVELLSVVSNSHIEITEATNLSNIVFHLMNFDDFLSLTRRIHHAVETLPLGDSDAKPSGSRVILSADGWKVTIDSTPFTKANVDLLEKLGGYAITHVGKIEREDASSFSLDEGKQLLEHLRYFLSFVRGSWVSPCLSIGKDTNGNEVWQEWGIRKTGPWSKTRSSFDKLNVEMLPPLYSGFRRQATNPTWSTELPYSIYWYVESNAHSGGTDGALIQSQVALESLSWNFLVNDKNNLSPDGFRDLHAADKFRLLISQCGIPLEVPDSLNNLAKFARANSNLDGPEAITRIRNRIVHPPKNTASSSDPRQQPSYSMEVYEAMTLALWYIELVILRLCGYDGKYSNRVCGNWVGEIEAVPWATVPHP